MWKSKIVQVDRKLNETDANDDGDDDATPHFTALRSTVHRAHSQVHPLRARIMSTRSLVPCANFITLTLA